MINFPETIALALVMFVATNADDLILLTVFFGQPNRSVRQIVAGQLVGILVLTGASIVAALLAMTAPHEWLPWLGVAPLFIGVRWLLRKQSADTPPEAARWWTIAAVTIANGADNLGVYIPTFALQTAAHLVIITGVFVMATLAWCLLARAIFQHPAWRPHVTRVISVIGPYILIGIGLWIILHHPFFRLSFP